jgi:hypothetical protein
MSSKELVEGGRVRVLMVVSMFVVAVVSHVQLGYFVRILQILDFVVFGLIGIFPIFQI